MTMTVRASIYHQAHLYHWSGRPWKISLETTITRANSLTRRQYNTLHRYIQKKPSNIGRSNANFIKQNYRGIYSKSKKMDNYPCPNALASKKAKKEQ